MYIQYNTSCFILSFFLSCENFFIMVWSGMEITSSFLPCASRLFNYCILQSVSSYFIDDMANSLFQQSEDDLFLIKRQIMKFF